MAKNWWEESTLESAAPKNESADEWWSGAKLENAPQRTLGEAIKDTGAQLAEGVNTTLGAIPSIFAPQSKVAGFFRDNTEHWRDQQSDVLKGRIAETDKRIQEAGKDGVMSQIGTAASEYWNDPAQAARLVATNLPSMAATLGTGAAAGLAAKGVAAARGLDAANKAALAAKYGTTTAYATNAALNAGGARGEAFEDLQKSALAQGMTPEQAEQAGVSGSILPGVVGGAAGAISGKIGLEKALLGQATTGAFMRKAGGAFGAELAGEQIEELAPKVATNYQVGQIDAARGLTDDMGRTMVETAIGAGPGAVVAGGAAGMRTGELPPSPGAGDPTTSPGAGGAPYQPAPSLTGTSGAELLQRQMDARNLDPLQAALRPVAGPSLTGLDGSDLLQAQMDSARQNPLLDAMRQDPVRAAVESAANAGGALSGAALVGIDTGASQQMADAVQAQAQADVSDEAAKGGNNAAQEKPVPLQPAVTGAEPVGSGALSPEERSGLATTIAGRELAGQPLSPEMAGLQAQLTQVQQRAAENGSWNVPLMAQRKRLEDAIAKLKPMEPPAERQAEAANAQAAQAPAPAAAPAPGPTGAPAVEAAGVEPAKAPTNRTEYVAEVRRQLGDLQPGDVLENDMGDKWTVDVVMRNKAGEVTGFLPREGNPETGEREVLDLDAAGSVLLPAPYLDASGNRKLSQPGKVNRAQPATPAYQKPNGAPNVPQTAQAQQSIAQSTQAGGAATAGPAAAATAGQPATVGGSGVQADGMTAKRALYDAYKATGSPDDVVAASVLKVQEKADALGAPVSVWRGAGGTIGVVPASQSSPFKGGELIATVHQNAASAKQPQEKAVPAQNHGAQGTPAPGAQGAAQGQDGAFDSAPLPATDVRLGDKVMVDGDTYTVTGPLKDGRKSIGVVASRDADTDPLAGVRQVFLRGDDAIRAKLAAQGQAAPTKQAAAPAEPEFTTIKTVYGDSVTVRTADLNGNKQRLRQYTKDGKSKAVPAIHRDNLDLTGDKRKARAKEDADNPFFNVITTKDGSTFASQAAATRELNRLAMGETHEVVSASEVQDGAQGFVIQRKLDAPAQETTYNGTRIYPTKVKVGDDVKSMWAAESPDNQRRRAAGERTIGGDSLHDTLEQAQAAAEREAKRDAEQQAAKAGQDAADKARLDAEEARKAANRPKTVVERRKDAILDGPSKIGQGTKRAVITSAVDNGYAIEAKMVYDYAAKKRDQETVDRASRAGYILGVSNENLPLVKAGNEAKARLKEGKYEKPEYRVYQGSDTKAPFREITKTEYDYAQELKAKQATRETITPADDKNIGVNVDGNQLYERKDGSIYQMQDGKPRFSGFLEPVSASKEAVAPADTAQAATENVATHKDPGEAPEAATAPVIAESLKTAAKREDKTPSEMRKWLVDEIDKELLQAADRPDYDEAVKRMGEKDATSMFTGNGWLGKNSETGYITFDVPGDGKYKVRNSVRGLLEFRKNVMASQGFKDGGQKRVKPEQNDGVQGGSGGQMAAITNMIEEGDFEAARDYAEAVGVSLDDVKVPKGERKTEWEMFRKTGFVPRLPDTRPQPAPKTAAQVDVEKQQAAPAETNQQAVEWAANIRDESKKEQAAPAEKPAIPEGYKPAGEPFYRGGKQIQGYAPFTIGERVTMKDSAGQSGVIESLAGPDDSGVFASAVVKFDNGMEQMVQFGKLEAAAPQPITRADVETAKKQAAAIIGERIDAMTAGEVNTIARRFLPTMGVRPTVSKERNKAAVTDFTKVNPLAAADEFGATLPADVRRVLQADMEGRVVEAVQAQEEAPTFSKAGLVGKALTKDQRRAVLETLVDVYKEKKADREMKGVDQSGNERYGFVYSPDLFEKSDITGAMVRYYVTLPDGRKAHPSELFPNMTASDVESMALKQEEKRQKENAFEAAIKPFYPDFDSANLAAGGGQVVVAKGDRFAVIPERTGAISQARGHGWELVQAQKEGVVPAQAPQDAKNPAKAVADGFVQEVNPFAEYDAVAKQYGYEVRPDGMIGSDGKFPGPKMAVQRGRLRVESGAGNLLGSYAATPESIGKFLEAFWYAEKKAVRGSAPAQQEAQQASDDRTKTAAPAKPISDVGEKIGGARKDTATSTGTKPRATAKEDDRPTWAKRYEISQVAGGFDMAVNGRDITGKWLISDTRSKDAYGQPKHMGRKYFDTKEEAEAALPLIAVSQKHRVTSAYTRDSNGNQAYEIWRDISDRKRVKVIDKQFATRDEAMEYMAKHPTEILEANTTFGEADIPKPESTERKGVERRTGDVKGEDFMSAFGMRGVEFGNWNNQAERQEVMNEAYDGLMDLAEVLNVPPKALGLNGDLALAFGARGQGLSSARAHYEPARVVMNLTKMNGAGALAHEWFHALDHYLARQDGKASAEWKVNKDGTRSLDVKGGGNDFSSSGFKYTNSGVREELRTAYTSLVRSLFTKAEQYVEDTAKADKFVAVSRGELEEQIAKLRADLSSQLPAYVKRNNKPASAEQLAEFDAIAAELVEGRGLATEFKTVAAAIPTRRASFRTVSTNSSLDKLSELYKAVRGRSGRNADKTGLLDSLSQYMRRYEQRLNMLRDASAETTKTKSVPTSFAMDAKSLDQGRGSDYWTTPHEMVARAFQGYVEDKIAEQDGKSPFLNYAPENSGIITPWGAKRPFPAGDERKAMNGEFDKFVGAIKTKETDKGVAMFSSADAALPAKPLTLDRVNQLVQEALSGIRGAPPVEVTARPGDIGLRVPAGSVGYGVTLRSGDIYVFQSAMGSDLDVFKTVFHELFHRGVRVLVPKAQYVQTMLDLAKGDSRIQQLAIEWKNTEMGQKQKDNLREQGYTGAELTGQYEALAIEEALAAVAEEIKAEGKLGSKPKSMTIRFLANWLAKLADMAGMKKLAQGIRAMTYNEAERFVMSAIDRSGEPVQAGRTDNMSAKRATPGTDQTQTEAFKRWFGDSKVVDADGKPMRVYHGTTARADFTAFNKGPNFFTPDPAYANNFNNIEGGRTLPVYLSLKNPLDARELGSKPVTTGEVLYFLARNNIKLAADFEQSLRQDTGKDEWWYHFRTGSDIQKAIQAAGYDGMIQRESAGSQSTDAYIAFRPEQIKSAIGNSGAFDPANADIRFRSADLSSRAGMASKARDELANAAGAAIKSITVANIKQRAGFKLTDYLGLGLQALGRRQIVDIYGDMLPLAEYNTLVTQMEADKNEGGAEADKLVTRWAELPDEGKLADLMHEATLAQIDPAKPYVGGDDKAKYAMLAGRFNALSQEARQVYTDTRDAYQAHHAKVRSAIKERIERSELKGPRKAELLKQMDDEFFAAVKGVYFPLARFGQYAVTVKGADGKVESVSRAETKAEAEALRNNLLSAFPRDKGFTVGRVMLSKDFIADRDAVGRGFMTELYQVLDKQDMDAAQRAELEDTLGQLYLSSLPDLSWAKHGIHRKGTPGFSQDARRAYAQNMFHGSRYLAKLRYSDLMQDELTAMQKHVDDWRDVEDFDQNSAQRVVDEMNKRHESLMNPKSNPLSTALTSLGFVFHLGLSPASAMVNLSQTALVAYPIMGAKWGFGKASAALLKASAEATKGKNDITGSLNADERAAYDEAVRAGTIDVTMAHDLAGIAQGEDAGVMWKIRPVMRWASFLFHHAERFNRQVTFVASYRLAREAGADQKAAFEQATKATYDGHFDYSASNRARIMQGNVAKVLLLFKQYGQNMVYTLSRNAYQSIKGTDAEKAEARKVLAGLLTSHAMAAGVLGLPMVTTLLAAASMIGGDDDEPWDAKVALQNMLADTLGQKPAEVLAHGLSRLTPWDISGRVGLDRLIFPDVQEGLEGQRLAESAMAAALGPVAGIGVNVLKGAQHMGEGRYALGLEAMMPAVLRGPVKAIRYANEGVQDKSGISILDEVSPAAVAGQALGFSPSQARNAQEGKSAVMAHDRALGERRQELLTRAARASMAKDAEALDDARKEIARFNEKNPGRRINPNHIMQSVRNRNKRIDQAQDGVYLPKSRRDAMQAGRFALAESE